jgi:hypothetical protein
MRGDEARLGALEGSTARTLLTRAVGQPPVHLLEGEQPRCGARGGIGGLEGRGREQAARP